MKKLIVSMKSTEKMFSEFKKKTKQIASGKIPASTHYEISFESKRDFNKFISNISVLISILNLKPRSIYQLATMTNKDISNMKKIINFFEEVGAVRIEEKKVNGRIVKTPIVDYKKIEFHLKAA